MILPADPKANYLAHKTEIDEAVHQVLDSGWYILGEEVAAFEKEFAAYLGLDFAIGVGSGTDALQLALRACDIGPGDAVVTVSHTAVATIAAIELAGATPVLVDVDPENFNMDPLRVEDVIKEHAANIKAVIPVHLYGHPADMPAIMKVAEDNGLYVIEDCSQSHGASIDGQKTGTWGHMSAFSFYPTKNLGGLGDGGAVVTKDSKLAEKVRQMREYGWRDRYISEFPGMNSRLDEIQAAVLRVKLRYLDEENARRREIARIYDDGLSGTNLTLPRVRNDVEHVYHQYVVRCKQRNDLKSHLKANSIGTAIHYPSPVHLQPAYQNRLINGTGRLEDTETICREILSLPMHPQMFDEQVKGVCGLIVNWNDRTEV